jgi:hypothetical protein
MKTALTVGSAGCVVPPSDARRLSEPTRKPEDDARTALAPSGRRVLQPTGKPLDAAAATRAERGNQSSP